MGKRCGRRDLRFESLPEGMDEARRLLERGYTKKGNWTLAQVCRHLSKTMRMSVEGASFSLPTFLQPVARAILFRRVMAGRPTRMRLKTAPQFRPDDASDDATEVKEFVSWVKTVMASDAPLLEVHPVFGRVTPQQWRAFHSWHAAHHFSFLIPSEEEPVPVLTTGSTSEAITQEV